MTLEDVERLIALMRENGLTHAKLGDVELHMDHTVELRVEAARQMREALQAQSERVPEPDPIDKLMAERFPD